MPLQTFERLITEGKRDDSDLRLCGAPISRAAYNALVLQVEETLKELHARRSSYPVPDLGNKVVLLDASPWEGGNYTELYMGRLVLEGKTVNAQPFCRFYSTENSRSSSRLSSRQCVTWKVLRRRPL